MLLVIRIAHRYSYYKFCKKKGWILCNKYCGCSWVFSLLPYCVYLEEVKWRVNWQRKMFSKFWGPTCFYFSSEVFWKMSVLEDKISQSYFLKPSQLKELLIYKFAAALWKFIVHSNTGKTPWWFAAKKLSIFTVYSPY